MVEFLPPWRGEGLDLVVVTDPAHMGVRLSDQSEDDDKRMSVEPRARVSFGKAGQPTGGLDLKLLPQFKFHVKSPCMTSTSLHLAKQNFKFSAAHFLIFDEKTAEKLHGHNYQVRVDLGVGDPEAMAERGFFVDFNVFKKRIKECLDQWDEVVLLPAKHPEMIVHAEGSSLEVRFRDRFYVFPKNEVVLLPITNTSVEQLSRLLAERFYREFRTHGVHRVRVLVEETRGQGASSTVQG